MNLREKAPYVWWRLYTKFFSHCLNLDWHFCIFLLLLSVPFVVCLKLYLQSLASIVYVIRIALNFKIFINQWVFLIYPWRYDDWPKGESVLIHESIFHYYRCCLGCLWCDQVYHDRQTSCSYRCTPIDQSLEQAGFLNLMSYYYYY